MESGRAESPTNRAADDRRRAAGKPLTPRRREAHRPARSAAACDRLPLRDRVRLVGSLHGADRQGEQNQAHCPRYPHRLTFVWVFSRVSTIGILPPTVGFTG